MISIIKNQTQWACSAYSLRPTTTLGVYRLGGYPASPPSRFLKFRFLHMTIPKIQSRLGPTQRLVPTPGHSLEIRRPISFLIKYVADILEACQASQRSVQQQMSNIPAFENVLRNQGLRGMEALKNRILFRETKVLIAKFEVYMPWMFAYQNTFLRALWAKIAALPAEERARISITRAEVEEDTYRTNSVLRHGVLMPNGGPTMEVHGGKIQGEFATFPARSSDLVLGAQLKKVETVHPEYIVDAMQTAQTAIEDWPREPEVEEPQQAEEDAILLPVEWILKLYRIDTQAYLGRLQWLRSYPLCFYDFEDPINRILSSLSLGQYNVCVLHVLKIVLYRLRNEEGFFTCLDLGLAPFASVMIPLYYSMGIDIGDVWSLLPDFIDSLPLSYVKFEILRILAHKSKFVLSREPARAPDPERDSPQKQEQLQSLRENHEATRGVLEHENDSILIDVMCTKEEMRLMFNELQKIRLSRDLDDL